MNLDLSKDSWQIKSIADVSSEVSDRIEEPKKSGYRKFVGLEHFESGEFFIKNTGTTENLNSAMKLFKNGDILFARRNAYLKRASLVDFDGLCSGDAIVLSQDLNHLFKNFLILILNTSDFWEYAISNAAGTMSRRVKWRDLAKYVFKLPPKEEQGKILNLFLTLENLIEQTEAQENNLLQTKRKLLNDLFSDNLTFGAYLKSNDYETITFEGIAEHISKRIEPGNSKAQIYVGLEHLDTDNLRIARTGKPTDVKGIKLKVYKDDIIFGKRRAYLRKVAVSHFDGICSAHSMVLRAVEQNIQKDFLSFFMQSDYFMNRAVQISEGSLSPTIKWKVLAKQKFHLPNKNKQDKLISLFRQIDNTSFQVRDFQLTLKKLKQKLLDEILG